jgi:hypothetical protein
MTCTLPGAHIIRDVLKKSKGKRCAGKKQKNFPRHTKKHWVAKAGSRYTPQGKAGSRTTTVRRLGVQALKMKGLASVVNQGEALRRLQEAKYLQKFLSCPLCRGNITEPFELPGRLGFFRQRCMSWGCRHAVTAYANSPFEGVRMSAAQLMICLDAYTGNDALKRESTDSICRKVEAGRSSVLHVTQKMGEIIEEAAQKANKEGLISGDLEADGHAVRSTHVSKANPHFKHLHPKADDKSSRAQGLRKAKYFLLYIRILGLRKRGSGKMYMAFGDPVLLPPRSKPPPENKSEVLRSNILSRAGAKSVIHFDGAHAWPQVIKDNYKHKKFRVRQVSHKNMEFVRKCRRVRFLDGSQSASLTGTQAVDSTWGSLSKFIPSGVTTKYKQAVNPKLVSIIFQWLWWANHPNTDGFKACGKLVEQWRCMHGQDQ